MLLKVVQELTESYEGILATASMTIVAASEDLCEEYRLANVAIYSARRADNRSDLVANV